MNSVAYLYKNSFIRQKMYDRHVGKIFRENNKRVFGNKSKVQGAPGTIILHYQVKEFSD